MAPGLHQSLIMKCFLWISLLFELFFLTGALAAPSGYVKNISEEQDEVFSEIKFEVPRIRRELTFNEWLFNHLASEFKTRYRDFFGENDTRSIIYRTTLEGGTTLHPVAFEKETQQRKLFAEYMIKRLVDYHVDNILKTKPELRPIMEVKEKIQNVKVQVTKEVRLRIQYNIVNNYADIHLDNPYLESKLSLEMEPRQFGPTKPIEARLWLDKNINTLWRSSTYFALINDVARTDLVRQVPNHQASYGFGLQTPYKNELSSSRNKIYLVYANRTF